MTLHILFESPFAGHCLDECRRVIAAGDALLLAGDGTYALAQAPSGALGGLHEQGVELFALGKDCTMRGIDVQRHTDVRTLDYGGFVELALVHERSVSWF